MSAPRAAARRNATGVDGPVAPVLGPTVSGWAGSTGASSEAGTSCLTQDLPGRYMTRA